MDKLERIQRRIEAKLILCRVNAGSGSTTVDIVELMKSFVNKLVF